MQQVLPLKEQLAWAKEVKKLLNLNDSSTLGMLQKIAKPYGNQLPLPDYTPSKGITKSATALLKEHGIDLSARKFNERLLKEGFLRKVERKSSKGMKAFLNLTDKGLAYGENVVSPHNPNETQPHFYQESFGELLSLLNIQKSGVLFNENQVPHFDGGGDSCRHQPDTLCDTMPRVRHRNGQVKNRFDSQNYVPW